MRLQRFRVFEDLISSLEKVFVRISEHDHSVTKIGERSLNVIARDYVSFVDAADDIPYAIVPPSVPLLYLLLIHNSLIDRANRVSIVEFYLVNDDFICAYTHCVFELVLWNFPQDDDVVPQTLSHGIFQLQHRTPCRLRLMMLGTHFVVLISS
jgi:hypothetical protein